MTIVKISPPIFIAAKAVGDGAGAGGGYAWLAVSCHYLARTVRAHGACGCSAVDAAESKETGTGKASWTFRIPKVAEAIVGAGRVRLALASDTGAGSWVGLSDGGTCGGGWSAGRIGPGEVGA